MSDTAVRNLTEQERLAERHAGLVNQVYDLKTELDNFRAQEPSPSRLQSKVQRQAKALHNLNKRVRVQRLMLRELNEQNPELANDLFFCMKDKYAAELDDVTGLQF